MTGITSDPSDKCITEIDPVTGMQHCYLVLPDGQRRELILPVRRSYKHLRCGAVTSMGQAIAETYAANPSFYGGTYCCACLTHYPVGAYGEFIWVNCMPADPKGNGTLVGTLNKRPEDIIGRKEMTKL